MRVDDGTVATAEGPAVDPDVVLTTDAATFLALGSGRLSHPEAVDQGKVTIEGDPEALRRARDISGPRAQTSICRAGERKSSQPDASMKIGSEHSSQGRAGGEDFVASPEIWKFLPVHPGDVHVA